MIFNKYSEVKEGNQTVIGAYKGSSSSSSSSSSSNKSVGLDREIWGQDDDGGDLNGDLTCEGNMYIVDNWDNNEDDEDDDIDGYSGASRKAEPIMTLSIADDLASKFDNDEGGNLYIKRQLVVEQDIKANTVYGKSIFLNYPTVNGDKTNILDILKMFDDATVWGQSLKTNNFNIIGNMYNVGDISFSGSSKVIGSSTSSNTRANEIYSNGNITSSAFNGNIWATTTNMKNIGAVSFLSPTSLTLNSIVDNNKNGHYYNNPRIRWWVFNPTSFVREGNWWLGPAWTNDYDNNANEGDHLNFSLIPSFDSNGMVDSDGNVTAEYYEQFEFEVGAKVKASKFVKRGGTNTQILMADGSVKEISDLNIDNSGNNSSEFVTKDELNNIEKAQPKILFSGILQSNNNDKTLTYQPFSVFPMGSSQYEGLKELSIEYVSSTTPAIKIGVVAKDGYILRATSSIATVLAAADGANNNNFIVTSFTAGEKRSAGYWTVGGTEYDGYSYWYCVRTGNEHSDATHFDAMAKRVTRLSITIFGIGYKS